MQCIAFCQEGLEQPGTHACAVNQIAANAPGMFRDERPAAVGAQRRPCIPWSAVAPCLAIYTTSLWTMRCIQRIAWVYPLAGVEKKVQHGAPRHWPTCRARRQSMPAKTGAVHETALAASSKYAPRALVGSFTASRFVGARSGRGPVRDIFLTCCSRRSCTLARCTFAKVQREDWKTKAAVGACTACKLAKVYRRGPDLSPGQLARSQLS